MITGKGGGTSKYSFRSASSHNKKVLVSHMPEDNYNIRIAFIHNEEQATPIVKISNTEAQLLWSALNSMAKDLNWQDYEPSK